MENKNERLIGQLERALEDLKNGNDLEKVRNDVFDNLLQNGESLTELAQKATYNLVTEKIEQMEKDDVFYSDDFLNEGRDYETFVSLTSGSDKENSLALNSILFNKEHDPLYQQAIDDINYSINNEDEKVDVKLELIINIEEGSNTYFKNKLEELGIKTDELSKSDLKEVANEVAKDMGKELPYSKEDIENDRKLEKTNEKENGIEY
jgi:hypothetical protein